VVRKIVSWVLIGLGAFLLVAAVLAATWAPGQLERTPLDTDSTTRLEGGGQKLNPATGEVEDITVKATSISQVDSEASDDDVVIFASSTCAVLDEGDVPDCVAGTDDRLVSASTEVFATDRHTGMSVDGSDYVEGEYEQREGLVNKWPFNAEKKDYPYWDGMLKQAVNAEYVGTETIEGLETYEYHVLIEHETTEVVEGVEGRYSMDKRLWIDPRTGAIIRQTQDELRTTYDGDVLLDLQLAFTDEQVKGNAADAKDNGSMLDLVTGTVPLVGFILGPILLIVGIGLQVLGRREHEGTHTA
jgi:hypothetical protein